MTKSIKAFNVTARVENESWSSKGTTLVASSREEAIEKATKTLQLKPEHVIEVEDVIVYHSSEKLTSENYPYGRLRATAYFSVEYNKKGARTVFQTICPKSGRLNKPKNSTYYKVILPCEQSNGHFDSVGYLDFNGTSSINIGLRFMADFHELFTVEQIKDIAITILAHMKMNSVAYVQYGGSSFDAIKPLMDKQIKTLVDIAKSGDNLFLDCLLDEEALEATKKADYQPFRITSHSTAV
nr:hypothetical protein [uncultured Flavobacterium sp.]